jgi:SAM-dependent methyltransferase
VTDPAPAATSLVVERPWAPAPPHNVKAPVLARRLAKTRARLESWRREIDMLSSIVDQRAGRGARVLDVACGTGFTVLELASRGFVATGLEADPALCELTNGAAAHFALPARAVAGDACRLPFATGSFDAVMSRSFFEHVYDRDLAIDEQLRVLRPGGVLIISDGNLLNPRLLFDLLVAYPLRTRFRHGGPMWLLTKRRVFENLYGYLPLGRDEDVKTPRWWRRQFARRRDCVLVESSTSARYMFPTAPAVARPFLGSCLVVAVKS